VGGCEPHVGAFLYAFCPGQKVPDVRQLGVTSRACSG
jgi:hypothetical protein